MRRSICYCEPSAALAGGNLELEFIYTTANHLPKGTKVRFDLASKGRPMDWEIPKTNLKEKANLIWAEIPGGKAPIAGTEVQHPQTFTPSFEFVLPTELKPGDSFSINLGHPEKDSKKGSLCQSLVQRKRPFLLYIDPKGKGVTRNPRRFTLT